jgi:hypothetical protein
MSYYEEWTWVELRLTTVGLANADTRHVSPDSLGAVSVPDLMATLVIPCATARSHS